LRQDAIFAPLFVRPLSAATMETPSEVDELRGSEG